ncbi:hypothetical protein D3C85_1140280 [compost metagenome]
MGRFEQRRAHRDFAARAFALVHPVARAAGGVQRQVRPPERGVLRAGVVDEAVVEGHDLGEEFLGRAEDAGHAHADEGVVAHEAGELQVLRVGADQGQHPPQGHLVLHAATVQPNIQLDIDPQPGLQPLGQQQVLLQALGGIQQPLQLGRRVEGAAVVLVEQLRRAHRQRLAEQDVGVGEARGIVIEEGLVERHQPAGTGAAGDIVEQLRRRQGLLHQAQVLASAAHRLHHHVDVVVQPVQVDQQHRPHGPEGPEFAVQPGEVVAVGGALVGRPQPGTDAGEQHAGPGRADDEVASIHGFSLLSGHAQDR